MSRFDIILDPTLKLKAQFTLQPNVSSDMDMIQQTITTFIAFPVIRISSISTSLNPSRYKHYIKQYAISSYKFTKETAFRLSLSGSSKPANGTRLWQPRETASGDTR